MTHGMGPQMCTPRAKLAPKGDTHKSHLPPKGPPSHPLSPVFQEEAKEEQTAMVPQAIPLRCCRYCTVLVGDAGTSVGGLGQGLDSLASPPSSRKPSQMPALTSRPHCWA